MVNRWMKIRHRQTQRRREKHNSPPPPQRHRLDALACRLLHRIRLSMNLHLPDALNKKRELKDPVKRLSYPLRAKKFIGKQIKVTGKLEMQSNTSQVRSIQLIP